MSALRIGILTGGGDVPGLNSVIKGVVYRATEAGHEVIGIRRGWEGLTHLDLSDAASKARYVRPLNRDIVRTIDRTGAPVLRATGIARRGVLGEVNVDVFEGEVVGIAGLLGSGRTELARLLFGLVRNDSGTLLVDGAAVRWDSPADAIRHGLAMCSEERKFDGIVADLSVRENIVLALQARLGLWPYLSRTKQQELAERFVQALSIKTASLDTPIALLSGGNQQKAVLARWLATEPRLLILDEPTRGIDVGAKQEIMDQVLALAREGMAVLFISSEIDEVVRVADRIVVLRDRAKVGELPGNSSEQAVYQLIAAGS